MASVQLAPDVHAALQPVLKLLTEAIARIPGTHTLAVRFGDVPGFAVSDGETLTLSQHLAGPGIHHPDEPVTALPPLDRWRRAAGAVLEHLATHAISAMVEQPPEHNWAWVGAAIHMADQAAPTLGLSDNDLTLAIQTGAPGAFPRAGVAVMRAWRALGHDEWQRVRYVLRGGVVSPQEWLELGRWVMATDGAAATLPAPVQRVPEADIPLSIEPWRWQPLAIPAHPRGGIIDVERDGAVQEPWAPGGAPHRTLAASAATGCSLIPRSGGPVGTWSMTSAEGFGQVMGARGVSFRFDAGGLAEITLADAFVGPLAAVTMAEEVGTSGLATGKWRVDGAYRISFEGVNPQGLTMHGRRRDRFAMPATGFGFDAWLRGLSEGTWVWNVTADRLLMRGQVMGGEVDVRFKRER